MNFKRTSLSNNSTPSTKKAVIRKKSIKTNYTRNTRSGNIKPKQSKKRKLSIGKIILYSVGGILLFFMLLLVIIYNFYLKDLPKISDLKNLDIAESSVIYDREGNVLYKIYKEKRTYVDYDQIGKNMVNAIVAGEDKRYWENPGIDIIGLIRAGIYGIIGKNEGFGGTSTLTQQLIRNTIIENRSATETIKIKLERKIKELYLAYELTNGLSKEKILELYLNKIGFGSNAYGIEQASRTFFNKSAIDLNILESSILASLPKGPTFYSPYTHPDRLLGYPIIFNKDDLEDKIEIISTKDVENNQEGVNQLKNYISNLKGNGISGSDKLIICGINKKDFKININVDSDGCSVQKYTELLHFLNGIKLSNENNYIKYQTGRKDFILGRMLEDGYINFEDYKKAIVDSIGYVFNQEKENISAPHFVFYVKEYLEEKYGKEIVSVGGFHIYTTLDPNLQNKANELIQKQVASNTKRFNATNAALISIDNKTGDILSMVGGVDYFDQENKGNVNIVTSPLQPGSSFKPFVYSIGIYNKEIGTRTPIYDLKTVFPGNYSPKNFDGSFLGKMDIATALNHSRNIPAIKMYYMAGGEENIVNFMKKLGVKSLKDHGQYGAPLALGTGEMTPLELAKAYSVFANLGELVDINPILKIVDSKGNIIEEKKEIKKEKVVSESQTYIINSMLSDTSTRPSSRNNYISISGRPVASKTGTSTKQFEKKGAKSIYPANLWTIGYTPQITTVVWAGNTDGSQVGMSGDGLNGAGPIWRDFMQHAHKNKAVENWSKPSSVYNINISEVSGFLPNPENTGNNMLVKSLFVNKPSKYDKSFQVVEVDALCGGKVSENTPEAAIRHATLVEFHSLNPNDPSWENPVQEWAKSDEARERYGSFTNLITSFNSNTCDRKGKRGNVNIKSNIESSGTYFIGENYLEIGYKSENPIKSIEILIEGSVSQTLDTEGKKEGIYVGKLFIPGLYKNKNIEIEIRAVDEEYYSVSEKTSVFVEANDTIAPEISLINPSSGSIKLYYGDYFKLKVNIIDNSKTETKIFLDGNEIFDLGEQRRIEVLINEDKSLVIGEHLIKVLSIDGSGNKTEQIITLEIMPK